MTRAEPAARKISKICTDAQKFATNPGSGAICQLYMSGGWCKSIINCGVDPSNLLTTAVTWERQPGSACHLSLEGAAIPASSFLTVTMIEAHQLPQRANKLHMSAFRRVLRWQHCLCHRENAETFADFLCTGSR